MGMGWLQVHCDTTMSASSPSTNPRTAFLVHGGDNILAQKVQAIPYRLRRWHASMGELE